MDAFSIIRNYWKPNWLLRAQIIVCVSVLLEKDCVGDVNLINLPYYLMREKNTDRKLCCTRRTIDAKMLHRYNIFTNIKWFCLQTLTERMVNIN